MTHLRLTSLFAAAVALVVTACGEKRFEYPLPVAGDFPKWVYQGSGSFMEDGKPVIVGIGMVGGIKNVPMAKTTAANRARSEIAKVLEVYSASLMKDYMASTTAGDMKASAEEQHVEQAIKTFSAATLSGITISDYWGAPDGTYYARAVLDYSLMGDLAKKAELDDKTKNFIRDNARKSFDALDKEEACQVKPGQPPGKPAADVLFVIDNSGSMQEEQQNLAKNFDNFFSTLTASGLDFHVGIVTTDVIYESQAGKLQGTVPVMTPATPALKDVFMKAVAVGTAGSTEEKGLEAVRLALSAPVAESANAGFVRPDARLAIILLSDEEDQSPLPVSQYTAFLSGLKGSLKRITFATIVGPEGGCQSPNGNAQPGLRYIEAGKTFGEYGMTSSICADDFGPALKQISGEISKAASACKRGE
jgi:hypothetical protein